VIKLLGMQPDVDKGVVVISGESKDFDGLMDYLARLGQGGALRQVRLVNHQVEADAPGKPIRFIAMGVWKAGA
jgi:hypothetical protein